MQSAQRDEEEPGQSDPARATMQSAQRDEEEPGQSDLAWATMQNPQGDAKEPGNQTQPGLSNPTSLVSARRDGRMVA
ncbi:MAG: hypothetical protein WBZ15_17735 [Mycobacterium sp.]|uniref:hypothetical protein n=1 Tax=Mycobacterium sp. TaxID=1785 RepID=UPI003C5AF0A4